MLPDRGSDGGFADRQSGDSVKDLAGGGDPDPWGEMEIARRKHGDHIEMHSRLSPDVRPACP